MTHPTAHAPPPPWCPPQRMLIPDTNAVLTQQRDEALSRLGEVLHEREELRAKLDTLLVQHREALAELSALRLAADQQHANEPAVIHQSISLMDNIDPSVADWSELSAFLDPAPDTTTGHVMPARALGPDKQRVGTFW